MGRGPVVVVVVVVVCDWMGEGVCVWRGGVGNRNDEFVSWRARPPRRFF
jgi:hypothetical protein